MENVGIELSSSFLRISKENNKLIESIKNKNNGEENSPLILAFTKNERFFCENAIDQVFYFYLQK